MTESIRSVHGHDLDPGSASVRATASQGPVGPGLSNAAMVRLLAVGGPSSRDGSADHAAESGALQRRILSSMGGGSSLPASLRGRAEHDVGASIGSVHVHRDAQAADLAGQLSARAFTVGQDIYFGTGAYAPETESGYHTLVHELVHTTQTPQVGPGDAGAMEWEPGLSVSDPHSPAEREAQHVAHQVSVARTVDDGAAATSTARNAPTPHAHSAGVMLARRCGDDTDCPCTWETEVDEGTSDASLRTGPLTSLPAVEVRRYSFDEFAGDISDVASDVTTGVVDTATAGVDLAGGVASDIGTAAVDTVAAVADAASDAASAAGDAASGAVDAVGEVATGVVDTAGSAVDNVASELAELAGDVGDAALALAQDAVDAADSLAKRFGGGVSIGPAGLRIDLPEIPLLKATQTPLTDFDLPNLEFPLLKAGGAIGPVVLTGGLQLELQLDPEVIGILGPASVQNVHILLNPFTNTYSANGRLHLAGSVSMLLPATASLELEVLAVILASEIPIPIEGDISAGLRLTLRASAVGTLDDDISLAYTTGAISLDTLNVLRLGAKIDADTSAVLQLKLYDHPLCVYTWPLAHFDIAENAGEYRLPVSLTYSSGAGLGYSAGPVDQFPIPFSAIDAKVPSLPVTRDCQPLDALIEVLCAKGILPPELCHGHGGEPTFDPTTPGPVPFAPPVPVPVLPPGPGPVVPPGPGPDPTPVEPASTFPSGKDPTNPRDHIPIIWFKPTDLYPRIITLVDTIIGPEPRDYDMNRPGQPVERGRDIGVGSKFRVRAGDSIQLEKVLDEIDRTGEQDAFKAMLQRHGFPFTGFDPDHVLDIQWSGPDEFVNLWPLSSQINRETGRAIRNQRITYSNVKGGGPAARTNAVLNTVAKDPGPDNVIGRFFIITGFR